MIFLEPSGEFVEVAAGRRGPQAQYPRAIASVGICDGCIAFAFVFSLWRACGAPFFLKFPSAPAYKKIPRITSKVKKISGVYPPFRGVLF